MNAKSIDARGLGLRGAALLVASLAFFVFLLDNSIVNLALVRLSSWGPWSRGIPGARRIVDVPRRERA